MNSLTIKNAIISDVDVIAKIEESSFQKGISESFNTIFQRVNVFREGVFVVQSNKDNEIIGYLSSEIWEYNTEIYTENFRLNHLISEKHSLKGEELYISSIAVLPDFRGSNTGKILLSESISKMVEKFPNIRSAILIVSAKWTIAKKMYKSNGFEPIAFIPNFFIPANRSCEDGIVMRKIINR